MPEPTRLMPAEKPARRPRLRLQPAWCSHRNQAAATGQGTNPPDARGASPQAQARAPTRLMQPEKPACRHRPGHQPASTGREPNPPSTGSEGSTRSRQRSQRGWSRPSYQCGWHRPVSCGEGLLAPESMGLPAAALWRRGRLGITAKGVRMRHCSEGRRPRPDKCRINAE